MSNTEWTRLTKAHGLGAFRTGNKNEAEAKGLIEREKRRLALFDLFGLEDLVKEKKIAKESVMKLPSVKKYILGKGALEDAAQSVGVVFGIESL